LWLVSTRKTARTAKVRLALSLGEDEGITPETAAALDRARASLARGEGIAHEEILREFGLNR